MYANQALIKIIFKTETTADVKIEQKDYKITRSIASDIATIILQGSATGNLLTFTSGAGADLKICKLTKVKALWRAILNYLQDVCDEPLDFVPSSTSAILGFGAYCARYPDVKYVLQTVEV